MGDRPARPCRAREARNRDAVFAAVKAIARRGVIRE